tara:strand:+ start:984 stop:1169 length:186 start_codon:yes stop_codon:yes gene_type:complete
MTKPSTEQLKAQLEELVKTHNEAVKTQQKCKEAIIGIQAIISDREFEDGDSNTDTSEASED